MKYKNKRKRLLCLLLALCSILAGINFNRLEPRAEINERKLYMDYLAKEEKRLKRKVGSWLGDTYAEQDLITGYKIIDLDQDGKKELIYNSWEGGARGLGTICSIRDGKVCEEACYGAAQFYRIKGSNSKIAVGTPTSAFDYYYYIYTIQDSKFKKKAVYHVFYQGDGNSRSISKNGKEISEKSFKRFEKKLKEIKI